MGESQGKDRGRSAGPASGKTARSTLVRIRSAEEGNARRVPRLSHPVLAGFGTSVNLNFS